MLITSVFLLILIMIYIFICRNNKISYLFGMYFMCVSSLLIIAVFYISKFTNYRFTFHADYNLYLFLLNLRIPLPLISNLFDICIAFYMFISILYGKALNNNSLTQCFLLSLPLIAFLISNNYNVSWSLFVYENTPSTPLFIKFIISRLGYINELLIIIYSILPFIFISKAYHATNFSFKKRYLRIVGLCSFLIITVIYGAIYKGLLASFNYSNIDRTKFPNTYLPFNHSISVIFTTFMIILVVGVLTIYYKPFSELYFKNKQKHFNYSKSLNKNIKITLHTYKNAFLSVNRLASLVETGLNSNNPELTRSSLDMLKKLSNEHLQQLEYTLSTFLDENIQFEPLNVIDALNDAIQKAALKNIQIRTSFENSHLLVFGNRHHLTEVFLNLIYNAAKALNNKPSPQIDISTYSLENYIFISVRDNGIGIDKKDLDHVFNLFYSKDPSQKGSGVGLYYVKNIVDLHHGYIHVDSKSGVYTEFQILLPAYSKQSKHISFFHSL